MIELHKEVSQQVEKWGMLVRAADRQEPWQIQAGEEKSVALIQPQWFMIQVVHPNQQSDERQADGCHQTQVRAANRSSANTGHRYGGGGVGGRCKYVQGV